eukprot:2812959-Amphidinium_carterae.2
MAPADGHGMLAIRTASHSIDLQLYPWERPSAKATRGSQRHAALDYEPDQKAEGALSEATDKTVQVPIYNVSVLRERPVENAECQQPSEPAAFL